ncbi:MAG: right-handed parallel beta-helix repeat-containing protein [Armatimonadetes bacterium]|nr:right-handed parallel beta-helix repeat-containing protein [Armatimonadota bacterium]
MRATSVALLGALLMLGGCLAQTEASGLKLYVAVDGSDQASGRAPKPAGQDGPFATLERARDEIRALKKKGALPQGGVTVELQAGTYVLPRTFELGEEDSGTEDAPITYRAARGATVRLLAGRIVGGFQPVTDPQVIQRLDQSVRGKVVQADLKAQGITDYGQADGKGLELFYDGRPMQIARWPNEGFVRIADLLMEKPRDVRGTKGDSVGKIIYEGERPRRWLKEKDLWLHGYWFWDWADQREKVKSIDPDRHLIELEPPYHHYGYRKGQWYYAYNALAEIDKPGEWYLDRDTGILYFYPPGPIEGKEVMVSLLPRAVEVKGASFVTLQGLVLEGMRDRAIVITGATRTRVVGCTVRNSTGGGVSISGGESCGVVACDLYDLGSFGLSLWGGERKTLTPAGHYAENNHIFRYGRIKRMYSAGISLGGVGNRACHNLIHDAPHQAMSFGGNDHLIAYNEIHSVCYESNDAGAIYAGRDWTARGTRIEYNYLHHITGFRGRGCVGVYLDDMYCGTTIFGNVFYKVTRAAFIGGGRDNIVENNIFVDCRPALHIDARALGWAKAAVKGVMKQRLDAVPYKKPPWSTRYPRLVNIWEDEPAVPKGNVVARNICWGGRWDEVYGQARPYVKFVDNLVDVDPHFVDARAGNFQLRDDSPAFKLGFKRIPIEKIGLYEDSRRPTWPVVHHVRPMPESPPPPAKASRPKRLAPPQVYRAARLAGAVKIDGALEPGEWGQARGQQTMTIQQDPMGKTRRPASRAWVAWDDTALLVAIENPTDPSKPLHGGNKWGQDDAVEVAVQNPAGGSKAPILVLRGYTTGHFESSAEAGAPPAAVKKAARGVQYAARVVRPGLWTAEWRIPFASLGVDPTKHRRLAFNISVRKTSPEPLWLMWQGTGAWTWLVPNAGLLELAQ